MLLVWISRIKRDPKKDFTVTKHKKLCSAHFRKDFVDFYAIKRNLKTGACPSTFNWTTVLKSELTETATEGEGEYDKTCRENFVFRFHSIKL